MRGRSGLMANERGRSHMFRGTHVRTLYAALVAATVGLTLFLTGSVQGGALVLDPGNQASIAAQNRTERPELQGDPLEDAIIPFVLRKADGTVAIAGHLHNRVFRSRLDGTLDF